MHRARYSRRHSDSLNESAINELSISRAYGNLARAVHTRLSSGLKFVLFIADLTVYGASDAIVAHALPLIRELCAVCD
jgi:hypothetical protein